MCCDSAVGENRAAVPAMQQAALLDVGPNAVSSSHALCSGERVFAFVWTVMGITQISFLFPSLGCCPSV